MKIVIDARLINESGIGRYLRNLLQELQTLDQTNEYFVLLLNKDSNLKLDHNFKKVVADVRWYTFKEQFQIPKILNQIKPDLVHFPHFNVPIFYQGKFVVTIHDLIHQHHRMNRATRLDPLTFKLKQLGYTKVFSHALKKTQKIIVPSSFVKSQLVNEWKVGEKKIIVTPEAVDDKIFAVAKKMSKGKIGRVMKKINIKQPYLFYVGNAHPHKNVEGLIKAFLNLKDNNPTLQLVLSGHDHYFWQRIKKEFNHPDIIYTGFVADEELVGLYKNAKAFVMPSFEEGFGIPLLEAMVAACPVVSSNAGSLLEVGGEAALYFNPSSQEEIIEKIQLVLNNEKLRADLIKKGKERVKSFSWKKLAKQTLSVYNSVL